MKRLRRHPFVLFQLMLLVLVSVGISVFLVACEKETPTEQDTACGSGRLTWDSKAQVCRDDIENTILNPSCCGH